MTQFFFFVRIVLDLSRALESERHGAQTGSCFLNIHWQSHTSNLVKGQGTSGTINCLGLLRKQFLALICFDKIEAVRAPWNMAKEAAGLEVHGVAVFRRWHLFTFHPEFRCPGCLSSNQSGGTFGNIWEATCPWRTWWFCQGCLEQKIHCSKTSFLSRFVKHTVTNLSYLDKVIRELDDQKKTIANVQYLTK